MNFYDKLQYLPVVLPALVVALVLHELAHAWVANALGDPTPKRDGRLSPHPVRHLDRFGAGVFAFTYLFFPFPFGWGQPVHVNRRNFRNRRLGLALVALAGPFANFLVAVGLVAVLVHTSVADSEYVGIALFEVAKLNVVLAVFNLLPVPPLDGSRLLAAALGDDAAERIESLDQYAILFFLVAFLIFQNQFFVLLDSWYQTLFRLIGDLVGG